MTRIVWTLQAVQDVEAIRSYIARDSPYHAALVAERIVESVEPLKEFPSRFLQGQGRRRSRSNSNS